jgi:hypothetical protein
MLKEVPFMQPLRPAQANRSAAPPLWNFFPRRAALATCITRCSENSSQDRDKIDSQYKNAAGSDP